ncbi:MAG TPA: DUF6569 family protein, partial [Candidatus Dormibacteraeota bacterium]|nr:DUF6569 family protein [Candidatus Dormibacteraeota bacterium]
MHPCLLLLAAVSAAGSPAGRFADEVQVGDPVSAENLTVYPLRLARAAAPADALPLDEAMRAGIVTAREVPGGTVNALHVSNRGERPVYAMAGDLLLGGKQDRIIGQS